jgi:DnaJ-class molecular chaperone
MPNVEGYGRGDLHVRIVPEVPSRLSGKQKKLLQELDAMRSESNYPQHERFRSLAEEFLKRRDAIRK